MSNSNNRPALRSKKCYRNVKQSIIIHHGVSKPVIVKACSVCGDPLDINCPTILSRFVCPHCGTSIENSNENRCKICHTMCSDMETLKAHIWGGCSNAGRLYPYKGSMRFRDEMPKDKVTA